MAGSWITGTLPSRSSSPAAAAAPVAMVVLVVVVMTGRRRVQCWGWGRGRSQAAVSGVKTKASASAEKSSSGRTGGIGRRSCINLVIEGGTDRRQGVRVQMCARLSRASGVRCGGRLGRYSERGLRCCLDDARPGSNAIDPPSAQFERSNWSMLLVGQPSIGSTRSCGCCDVCVVWTRTGSRV